MAGQKLSANNFHSLSSGDKSDLPTGFQYRNHKII